MAVKALALVSGGLDSILAVKLLQDQGIKVDGVRFVTPFADWNLLEDKDRHIDWFTDRYGIPLEIIDVSEDYLNLLAAPSFGFGKNYNPCIDCHIYFLRQAKKLMAAKGVSFIATGEVLGQRPMSQRADALKLIEKKADLSGYLLRPLSALKLPPTEVEKKGWVDREKLEGIFGRGRKRQLELAARFGIDPIPSPAGGCLLTDPAIGKRVADLYRHSPAVELTDALLVTMGRHFRLSPDFKLIVGRNQEENQRLDDLAAGKMIRLAPVEVKGPVAYLTGRVPGRDRLLEAAAILLRYSDISSEDQGRVEISDPRSEILILETRPAVPDKIDSLRL